MIGLMDRVDFIDLMEVAAAVCAIMLLCMLLMSECQIVKMSDARECCLMTDLWIEM